MSSRCNQSCRPCMFPVIDLFDVSLDEVGSWKCQDQSKHCHSADVQGPGRPDLLRSCHPGVCDKGQKHSCEAWLHWLIVAPVKVIEKVRPDGLFAAFGADLKFWRLGVTHTHTHTEMKG